MPYELTINRFGVIPTTPILSRKRRPPSRKKLINDFLKQAGTLADLKEFKDAHKAILGIARAWQDGKTAARHIGPEDNGSDDDTAKIMPASARRDGADATDEFNTLVALLPYRRIRLTINGTVWIVRVRASMTSCALQTDTRQTKLWCTVEGIPLVEQSDEVSAAAFTKLAEAMQAAAMPHLATAYERSLSIVTDQDACFDLKNGRAIRVSLTDNEAGPVADLFDSLRFEGATLPAIEAAPGELFQRQKQALHEFKTFIADVSDKELSISDETVTADNTTLDDARGLLCRNHNTPRYSTFVAGFARGALGTGFPWRGRGVPKKEFEHYIRLTSPARHLSAELADAEAQALDARLAAAARPIASASPRP